MQELLEGVTPKFPFAGAKVGQKAGIAGQLRGTDKAPKGQRAATNKLVGEEMQPAHVNGKEKAGAVTALEKALVSAKKKNTKFNYDIIDGMMQKICKQYNLTGQKLHDDFVKKHHQWPDNWIKTQ